MSSCTFDREQLSLYAGDDLPDDERGEVEAHLADCPVCAAVLKQYGNLGAGLRLAPPPSAQAPRLHQLPVRRPAWGALVTTVAVAILALAFVREPVLAAVQRWFQVEEVSPEQAQEMGHREIDWSKAIRPSSVSMGPDAAPMLEERYGRPVSYPELAPEWELFSVSADQAEKPTWVTRRYEFGQRPMFGSKPILRITYSGLSEGGKLLVPPGMSEQLTVNGREAWLVRGAFTSATPSGYTEGDESSLFVRLDGQEVQVTLNWYKASREEREAELMRIAESFIK